MRIIITGGAGFIGSEVYRNIFSKLPNSELLVIDNLSFGKKENIDIPDHLFLKRIY
jgi:dTDP-D-glucose 4,6-dehydratase